MCWEATGAFPRAGAVTVSVQWYLPWLYWSLVSFYSFVARIEANSCGLVPWYCCRSWVFGIVTAEMDWLNQYCIPRATNPLLIGAMRNQLRHFHSPHAEKLAM